MIRCMCKYSLLFFMIVAFCLSCSEDKPVTPEVFIDSSSSIFDDGIGSSSSNDEFERNSSSIDVIEESSSSKEDDFTSSSSNKESEVSSSHRRTRLKNRRPVKRMTLLPHHRTRNPR